MEEVAEFLDVAKCYGQRWAVQDLRFSLRPSSSCALLGANGAGKSTVLALLLGLLTPTSGRIRVLGEDVTRRRYRVAAQMNFCAPYLDLPQRLSVRQNLTIYAMLYGVPPAARIRHLAAELELEEFLKRPYGSLSTGQRARVGLAKALLNEPRLLLLDEPTASLDPIAAEGIRTYLDTYRQRSGATLLLASHNMREVEQLCDRVLFLRHGRLVADASPAELRRRFKRADMEKVFLDVQQERQGER